MDGVAGVEVVAVVPEVVAAADDSNDGQAHIYVTTLA